VGLRTDAGIVLEIPGRHEGHALERIARHDCAAAPAEAAEETGR